MDIHRQDIADMVEKMPPFPKSAQRVLELTSDRERPTIEIGSAKVTNILMNHPVLNFGYKIECNGKSVFFTGDNEPLYNIYSPRDEYYTIYEGLIAEKNSALMDFIRGTDILIADAAYTVQEYPSKKGWGHGTFDSCISMAKEAKARKLFFTHHEPLRSDEQLDEIYSQICRQYSADNDMPEMTLAREGLEIIL